MSASLLNSHVRLAEHPLRKDESLLTKSLLLSGRYLGAMIGDGNSNNTEFTNVDQELTEYFKDYAATFGLVYQRVSDDPEDKRGYIHWRIDRKQSGNYHIVNSQERLEQRKKFAALWEKQLPIRNKEFPNKHIWLPQIEKEGAKQFLHHNALQLALRTYNFTNNKHIPEDYFKASREVRLELLAGIIDTDGYNAGYTYEITQKSVQISEGIVRLCNSLGFFVDVVDKLAIATNAPNHKGTWVKRMKIYGANLWEIPCLIPRKKMKKDDGDHNVYLPLLRFLTDGKAPVGGKKRKLMPLSKEEEELITQTYEKHKNGKNRWATTLKDDALKSLREKNSLRGDNIRDFINKRLKTSPSEEKSQAAES